MVREFEDASVFRKEDPIQFSHHGVTTLNATALEGSVFSEYVKARKGKYVQGYGIAIYSLQVEQNRYISSLQIYLGSVKWKIFVTGVTKHFQAVKKGAKWGQNANYRQIHYGNAIYSLQVEQNRYMSSLQIYLDSVK